MTAPDPRPLLTRALDQIGALVDTTAVDRLGDPTPCTGWDVRTLLGHLVAVHRRVAHVARGGDPFDIPRFAEVPDGRYAAALAAARADVDAVWGDEAVLDRVLTLPWGRMPGRHAGFGYVQEYTVHAWDLAAATGRTGDLDPGLAEAIEDTARRVVPAEGRGEHVPFGPVVAVGPDAGPYERLVGWLGRDPRAVPV